MRQLRITARRPEAGSIRPAALLAAIVALHGCVDPQKTCTGGLPEMKARLDAVVGYTEHPDVNELMAQARLQYVGALADSRRGDYASCAVGLEQAQILLDKAKRLRRELAG